MLSHLLIMLQWAQTAGALLHLPLLFCCTSLTFVSSRAVCPVSLVLLCSFFSSHSPHTPDFSSLSSLNVSLLLTTEIYHSVKRADKILLKSQIG